MISRREALKGLALLAGGTFTLPVGGAGQTVGSNASQFSYCLNTSTISSQKTGFLKAFEITSKAGYDGIEIWIRDLEKYVQEGGNKVLSLELFNENYWKKDAQEVAHTGLMKMKEVVNQAG